MGRAASGEEDGRMKYGDGKMTEKKKYKVIIPPNVQAQIDALSPENREDVLKALEKIAEGPEFGEPSKPCPRCGKYFWHSDEECPFCGFVIRH